MDKKLNEMTGVELGKLFPIKIRAFDPAWKENYQKEKFRLQSIIGNQFIVRISHYGSTAVPGLLAKPTIDILLEIDQGTDVEMMINDLRDAGYIYIGKPENPPPSMMFVKGYTAEGFKGQTYHIHVRFKGDWDELYFRDFLITHPEIADLYGKLKLELKEKFEHDRDAYTEAKTEFIKKYTEPAREEMPDRYGYD